MLSVHDPEWDRYGWITPGLPKEQQPDRRAALREEQVRRLLGQCNIESTGLGDQKSYELVTSTKPAEGQTNG